jgi:hypothetical protein
MAFSLTQRAKAAAESGNLRPNMVVKIDGVDTCLGAVTIFRNWAVGDGVVIGDPLADPLAEYIGGLIAVGDQLSAISFKSSSQTIKQQLQPDRGIGSGISTLKIGLVDFGGQITDLMTPGNVITDLLGSRAKVWYGFENTAFPEDYIPIFAGQITAIDSGAGFVNLTINHPDNKKRKDLYQKAESVLDGAITSGATVLTMKDVSGTFLDDITGPDGTEDTTTFQKYVRIDDEIIKYTDVSGLMLTGLTRAQFGTIAVGHDDEATVESMYQLTGNIVDLSLKLMSSGIGDNYLEDQPVTNFNVVNATTNVPNSIFFSEVDVFEEFGITVGDYITTTGAASGANNVTLEVISDIVSVTEGDYIVVDGVTFVDEVDSAALISFRSRFDTLPDGMQMAGFEIDVEEHERLQGLFLSNFDYDFLLKDTIDGRDFLEQELYLPSACYSLPRKTRASMGYHIGPIPRQDIAVIDDTTVKNPDKIKIKRATTRNFYNEVVYKFEPDPLEDRFLGGEIIVSATSKNQIGNSPSTLTIEANGLKSTVGGRNTAQINSARFLDRYEFAAESINVSVFVAVGINLEPGDIVLFDGSNLKISDITQGSRLFVPRLMEIVNKSFNLRTGDIDLVLVDTNFDEQARTGLICPASNIKAGLSTSQFIIEESFPPSVGGNGVNEFRKWEAYVPTAVKVRNADFSVNEDTILTAISGNTLTVDPLSFTPSAGMIMEFSNFDNANTSDKVKLVFTFMADDPPGFTDGSKQFQMI